MGIKLIDIWNFKTANSAEMIAKRLRSVTLRMSCKMHLEHDSYFLGEVYENSFHLLVLPVLFGMSSCFYLPALKGKVSIGVDGMNQIEVSLQIRLDAIAKWIFIDI